MSISVFKPERYPAYLEVALKPKLEKDKEGSTCFRTKNGYVHTRVQ